jgi:uncharacterized protein
MRGQIHSWHGFYKIAERLGEVMAQNMAVALDIHNPQTGKAALPNARPYLGFGLGLRHQHYEEILAHAKAIQPPAGDLEKVDWFEIISENYLVAGGKPLAYLDQVRAYFPLVMHGVSLSIGSTDPLDYGYLAALKALAARIEPAWVSDHLCWTGHAGVNSHDLLPMPYTESALEHVCRRVLAVQDYLQRPLVLENASTYISFRESTLPEAEFLAELCRQTDCRLLLDVNNVYVSAYNHGFSALEYLKKLPASHIWQLHLAGHSNYNTHIIDTHDAPVIEAVWELYREVVSLFGPISTMIERDDHIPPYAELQAELAQARHIAAAALAGKGM